MVQSTTKPHADNFKILIGHCGVLNDVRGTGANWIRNLLLGVAYGKDVVGDSEIFHFDTRVRKILKDDFV